MAFSINQVYLVGNVASEVELRYTPNGTAVLNFSVATNRSVKQGDNWEDVPTFHRIVVWSKLAEYLAQNISKGSKVVITGRIENSSYEKDGQKFYKSEIVAQDVIPMVAKGGAQKSAPAKKQENPDEDFSDIPDDLGEGKKDDGSAEDIPF